MFYTHMKDILKTVFIIAAVGGLLWLGISKFDNVANENANSTIEHRQQVEDSITDNGN